MGVINWGLLTRFLQYPKLCCCPYLLVYPVNTLQRTSLLSQNTEKGIYQES